MERFHRHKDKILIPMLALLVAGLTLCLLHLMKESEAALTEEQIKEKRYLSGFVSIHKSLSDLRSLCLNGNFDAAYDTFLELQYQWQKQDAMAATIKNPDAAAFKHYPSDSLVRLEILLNQLSMNVHNTSVRSLLIKEIKKLHEGIDKIRDPRM